MSATIRQLLHAANQHGLARIDAQLLLLHALGRAGHDRAWLLAHDQDIPDPVQQQHWQQALARRLAGEPVAYITGRKAFYGLELHINHHVLDPRPDTETLVDWALELPLPSHTVLDIADLGTGSGAVALALASQRRHWQIVATDISPQALAIAQRNADALGLAVQLILAGHADTAGPTPHLARTAEGRPAPQATAPAGLAPDIPDSPAPPDSPDAIAMQTMPTMQAGQDGWYACLRGRRFHAIVSNPPYITQGDTHLHALRHEPAQALGSGPDGLDDIRSIIAGAPAHLHTEGWLLLEHGHDQAHAVQCLLRAAGFCHIQSRQDLAGIARCSGGQWPGPDNSPA